MEEVDLSEFEHGRWCQAALNISKTANLVGFSRLYREWSRKEEISSEWQFFVQKCLVDARDQWKMARLLQADRKAILAQTCYNKRRCRRVSLIEKA